MVIIASGTVVANANSDGPVRSIGMSLFGIWSPYEYVRAALRSPVGGGMLDRPAGLVMIGAAPARLLPQLHRVACMVQALNAPVGTHGMGNKRAPVTMLGIRRRSCDDDVTRLGDQGSNPSRHHG